MIEIQNVFKRFGEKDILRGISATINDGEVFTIIGPSGQGKSTLLRLINLLDDPTSGRILFDGVDIHAETPRRIEFRRKMGMVFQKPAAFNATVEENIAFGLKYRGVDRSIIKQKVADALEEIGLGGYGDRRAQTLSGGEMQRVALARSMVTEPDILLLDEPTANLDPLATKKIEELILHYNREYGTTVVMSTHDMFQGQRLADRIAVMMHGVFSQTGNPRDVFAIPRNKEVARFIGVENIIEGSITAKEEGVATIDASGVPIYALTPLTVGEHVSGCIRPDDVTLHVSNAKRISALNVLEGTITKIVPVGSLNRVMVDCGIHLTIHVTGKSVSRLHLAPGDEVCLSFKAGAVQVVRDDSL